MLIAHRAIELHRKMTFSRSMFVGGRVCQGNQRVLDTFLYQKYVYASTAISHLSHPSTANSITKSPTCKRVTEICPCLACQVNLCDLPSLRISSGKDSYSFADSECASSVCQSLVEVDREYLCFHIVSMSFAPILNLGGFYGQGLQDQEKRLHETFPFQCFHLGDIGGYAQRPSAASELQNQRPAHIPHALSPVRSVLKSSHQTWRYKKEK